jgi:preprotein translocase subunit SecA
VTISPSCLYIPARRYNLFVEMTAQIRRNVIYNCYQFQPQRLKRVDSDDESQSQPQQEAAGQQQAAAAVSGSSSNGSSSQAESGKNGSNGKAAKVKAGGKQKSKAR